MKLQPLPEGAVLLGRGGKFKVPKGPFLQENRFWGYEGYKNMWGYGGFLGNNPSRIYAAPADSEIARLNADLFWNAQADEFNQWEDLGDDERQAWINGEIEGSPWFKGEFLEKVESGTPRTDEAAMHLHGQRLAPNLKYVSSEFARTLERESAAKDEVIRGLVRTASALIADMKDRAKMWAEFNEKPVELPVGNGVLHDFQKALQRAEQGKEGM